MALRASGRYPWNGVNSQILPTSLAVRTQRAIGCKDFGLSNSILFRNPHESLNKLLGKIPVPNRDASPISPDGASSIMGSFPLACHSNQPYCPELKILIDRPSCSYRSPPLMVRGRF